MNRHFFQVSIVGAFGSAIIAKRSTRDKAEAQAQDLRDAIGTFNRAGVPRVVVTDLRENNSPADYAQAGENTDNVGY